MKRQLLCCLLAGLVLAAAGCRQSPDGDPQDRLPVRGKPSDPPVELKAQWRPGYRYMLFVETAQTSATTTRRGSTTMESTLAQDYAITVGEGRRGGRSLDVQFKSLAVSMYFGDRMVVFYDSLNSVTSPQGQGAEALEGLIDAGVTVQLKRDGTVADVEGMRELIAKVGGGDVGRARGLGMMQRYFSPTHFRQFVEFSGLPAKAVAVGETWSAKRDMFGSMVGMLVMETTNTFVGWQERQKRQCARIAITGQISLPTQPNRQSPGDVAITDGQVKGTMWLDPKLEFPVELSLEQTYTVVSSQSMRGPRNAGTNAPASVPVEKTSNPARQTLRFKLMEAAAGAESFAPPPAPAAAPRAKSSP